MRPRPFRLRNVLVMVLVALFVNAPLADDVYARHRLAADGEDVTAYVLEKRVRNRQPELVVEAGETWVQPVEQATYDDVREGQELPARVVRGTDLHRLDGAQRNDIPLGLAILGDGGLVLVVAGMLLYRRRFRVPALWAVQDVRHLDGQAEGRGSLLRVGSTEWIVSGQVMVADGVAVVIDAGREQVRIELAGHANPVGRHQHAQVVARVPPSGRMSP